MHMFSWLHGIININLNSFPLAGESNIHERLVWLQVFQGVDNIGMKTLKMRDKLMGLGLETVHFYLSNGHSNDPPDPSYSLVIDSLFVVWLTD